MRIKAIREGINDLIWKLIFLLIIGGIHLTLRHFGIIEQMVDITLFILVILIGISTMFGVASITKCFFTGGNYFIEKKMPNIFTILFSNENKGNELNGMLLFIFYLSVSIFLFPLFILIYIYSFFQGTDNNYEVDDFYNAEEPKYKKELKEKVIKDKYIPKKQKVEEKKYEEPLKEKVVLESGVVKGGNFILKCESFSGMSHNKIPKEDNYGFKNKEYAVEKGMSEYGKSRKWWILDTSFPTSTVYQSWK